jgi:hypothetical protein
MTTRSINEGNIPFVAECHHHSFRIPYSIHTVVWRIVHENKTNFLSEAVSCSECDDMRECIQLSDRSGTYYLCKKCCLHIWNYVQDSIF